MGQYVKVRFAIDDEEGYESYLFKLEKEQCRDIVNYLMFISEPIGEEEEQYAQICRIVSR